MTDVQRGQFLNSTWKMGLPPPTIGNANIEMSLFEVQTQAIASRVNSTVNFKLAFSPNVGGPSYITYFSRNVFPLRSTCKKVGGGAGQDSMQTCICD